MGLADNLGGPTLTAVSSGGRAGRETPNPRNRNAGVSVVVRTIPRMDDFRISGRFHDALLADLVVEEPDLGWLKEPIREPYEVVRHLARQLGLRDSSDVAGLDATLLFIAQELEALLRGSWPPSHDLQTCRSLVHEAVKHLHPSEVYATLNAGPAEWRKNALRPDSTVQSLRTQLPPILERAMTTAVSRMIGRWVTWDVPALHRRNGTAVDRVVIDVRTGQTSRTPYQRATGRDRQDRLDAPYVPPGRT